MTSSMNTILVLGGTSGIGLAFAKRFQSQGKRVIITGRREAKLKELHSEFGLEGYAMDNTDFPTLQHHSNAIMSKFPDIGTVWINAGTTHKDNFLSLDGSSDELIHGQIAANITGPTLLARYFIPFLIAKNTETTFMITSSGTGYLPVPFFPVYAPSKAYIHSFMVCLRQQLQDTKVNVIEIVPPLVNTGLGVETSNSGTIPSMSLQDFEDDIFAVLDGNKARDLKEVTAGTGVDRVGAWRNGSGKLLESMGLGG